MNSQKPVKFAKKFKHKCTNDKTYCKYSSHCHYTGKYGGGAHSILVYINQKIVQLKNLMQSFTMD